MVNITELGTRAEEAQQCLATCKEEEFVTSTACY